MNKHLLHQPVEKVLFLWIGPFRSDFASLPAEVLDKLRIEFYSDPSQAAFKALVE